MSQLLETVQRPDGSILAVSRICDGTTWTSADGAAWDGVMLAVAGATGILWAGTVLNGPLRWDGGSADAGPGNPDRSG